MEGIQIEIEKNVLSHLIACGKSGSVDTAYDIISKVEPEYFTEEKHQILYTAIVGIVVKHKRIDILSLYSELNANKKLELSGGNEYLASLGAKRDRSTTVQSSVNELVTEYKRREFSKHLNTALEDLSTKHDVDMVMNGLDEKIYQLSSKQVETMVDVVKTTNEIIEKANNAQKYGCYGYSWGISGLDFITSGIEVGKTYVIGATKKSGKTKFVINTIKALTDAQVKVHFLSLEMNGESVVKELISRFASVNNNVLKTKLYGELEEKIRTVSQQYSDVEIDTQSFLNITQVRYKVRQAAQRGCKVIFMDYLQRMDFQLKGNNQNFATVIAGTVSQIADIAKEFGVAFIFLSQLRNNAENEQADISYLKDSGGIAEGVDCIIILNNQDRINKVYDQSQKTDEIWMSIEQRSGQSGIVRCKVDLSKAEYREIENGVKRAEVH